MMNRNVRIFTDGACRGSGDVGGWCALITIGDDDHIIDATRFIIPELDNQRLTFDADIPSGHGTVAVVQMVAGHVPATTNNRMELQAVISGIAALKSGTTATVYTDSEYVCNCFNTWIEKWKRSLWTGVTGEPVANKDLLEELDAVSADKHIKVVHLKKGDDFVGKMNVIADRVAKRHKVNNETVDDQS